MLVNILIIKYLLGNISYTGPLFSPTNLSTSVLTSCDALNITWELSSYTGVAESTLKYHLKIDSKSYTTYNTSYIIDKLECGVDYTISLSASVCEQEMSESVDTSRLIFNGKILHIIYTCIYNVIFKITDDLL